MRLDGKTAIVTGSSKGIGLAIARAYVKEGGRVVINSRHALDCAAVARELGAAATPIAADLARGDDVRRLAQEGQRALGGVVDISSTTRASHGSLRPRTCRRPTIGIRSTSTSTATSS